MVKRMKRTKRIETDFDTPHPPLAASSEYQFQGFFRSFPALFCNHDVHDEHDEWLPPQHDAKRRYPARSAKSSCTSWLN